MFGKINLIVLVAAMASSAAATTIHVNAGCILVDGQTACGSKTVQVGSVIYARFDSGNHDAVVTPGCELTLQFPAYYGQIFYGKDDCIYDATGANIEGQCCKDATTVAVNNPYYPTS